MNASKSPPVVSPAQIRAARALLHITGAELAEAAQVNISTVRRFEDEGGQGSPLGQRAMKAALESMGIEFIGLRGVLLKDDA
jgi:DNA-binding transcriptional regulator YiaG